MEKFEESSYANELISFHLPRYEEIPDIELYMDQVISLIHRYLSIFTIEDEKLLTKSMVNNYVKQQLVSRPVNKKYNRNHITYLIIVCLFKQFLSINEICQLIEKQISVCPIERAYNYFCLELENALSTMFTTRTFHFNDEHNTTDEAKVVHAAAIAFANKVYMQKYICYLRENEVSE